MWSSYFVFGNDKCDLRLGANKVEVLSQTILFRASFGNVSYVRKRVPLQRGQRAAAAIRSLIAWVSRLALLHRRCQCRL